MIKLPGQLTSVHTKNVL